MEQKPLKVVMVILIIVALALAGALAYVWYQQSNLVKELTLDKENLTQEMIALQNDYASLSSDYDMINSQLDSSREEVSQLIERLKKTEATNRSKMRQYERELGTLRSIMKNYIVQIDSLNTLNKKLTADAAAARREAAESRRQSEELSKTVENLSGQVAAGAVIKARGLMMEAYNASDKVTDRSSRVVRINKYSTIAVPVFTADFINDDKSPHLQTNQNNRKYAKMPEAGTFVLCLGH